MPTQELTTPSSSPVFVPPSAPRILAVDDEQAIRESVGRFLRTRGYYVQTAESGTAALDRLTSHRFDLLLCDVAMPGPSGLDVAARALGMNPDLAVVMLTAMNTASVATSAITNGAMDYITKPCELPLLAEAIEKALKKRALAVEQRRVERMIREEVAVRTAELEREKAALRTLTVNVAETLINAMEAKDIYLRGHSQRVADVAAAVADALGLDADGVEQVRLAGRLHDVGQIGIRESVLNKPDKLTVEEFEHIKDHVRIGIEILAPLQLGTALTFVHDHHERWDGTGYPLGLRGEEISIGGRILAAADAFDALTSTRAYRASVSREEAIDMLASHVGSLLDPQVYDALCSVVVKRRSTLVFIETNAA